MFRLSQRRRKLIGVLAIPAYLTLYCLIAMAAGASWTAGASPAVLLGFYFAAGLLWLPGAALIIRWMSRGDG